MSDFKVQRVQVRPGKYGRGVNKSRLFTVNICAAVTERSFNQGHFDPALLDN